VTTFFVVRGRWRGRKPHLRRFASLALLHVCIYTSAPARLTNHPHLRLPLHAIVRLHAAALSYLAESADIASELSIGLCFATTEKRPLSQSALQRATLYGSGRKWVIFFAYAIKSSLLIINLLPVPSFAMIKQISDNTLHARGLSLTRP
jgi:hypothetical protein